ncbi:hypothetical protein EBR21_15760 [bacterium]|nr:hypothetical protein [bacterium]
MQMANPASPDAPTFNRADYQEAITNQIPKTIEETLPFFVRMVWNRKFNFETNTYEIEELAREFSRVVSECGGRVDTEELVAGCRSSLADSTGIRN